MIKPKVLRNGSLNHQDDVFKSFGQQLNLANSMTLPCPTSNQSICEKAEQDKFPYNYA